MTLNYSSFNFSNTALPANSHRFANHKVKERILIVDDEAVVRQLFNNYFSEQYECCEAASTSEALAQLAEKEFSVVIADVIMPGLSGTELLRKIIENYPYTAVIMVSGINNPQRALDALRLGAFDYLVKPCDLFSLELIVERAIERRTLILNTRQYKIDLENRNKELATGKSELERLQEQIIHSEKMASLGQLAAGVAHELNNPVGFIYGNLDLLNHTIIGLKQLLDHYDKNTLPANIADEAAHIKKLIDYEASRADLDSIISDCLDGAGRIRDIVQNLRTFSRLDESEFAKTEIHEGIDSTIRLLSSYFSSSNIKLIRDYGELPPIDGFSGQLNQLWMNLLVNAAQAVSPTGGEVHIISRILEESVEISIKDTGCGIPSENLSRIFDPFYTTKPVGKGTGLGLSISFGIVKRHGGTIRVETNLGTGTTFTVTLPIQIKISSAESAEILHINELPKN